MSDKKLIIRKDQYTNKEVYISPEKLKQIADFNKKPYSVEMMEKTEKLEKSNKEFEQKIEKLEIGNKELKVMLKEILSYHRKSIIDNK